MKLTKEQIKKHEQALKLLEQDSLKFSERFFVLENYHEGATHMNGKHGAFFTPVELAKDFSIEIWGDSVLDLCAGIGHLSFWAVHHRGCKNVVCVELNEEYYNVGRKVLPEATWIHGNIFDLDFDEYFDCAISNPPFGNIKTVTKEQREGFRYTGSEFELLTIECASKFANEGIFILPSASTTFSLSTNQGYQDLEREGRVPTKVSKFISQTNIKHKPNMGISTLPHKNDWRGVSPSTEIVLFDFIEARNSFDSVEDSEPSKVQTSLF